VHTTTAKTSHKYNDELEEKLMYMNDEELYCFFENNTIEYEESLEVVVMRYFNEGI